MAEQQDLLAGFDASKVDTSYADPQIALPAGQYLCSLEAKQKTTKAGDPYINIDFKVLDGEYKGRHIFQMYQILNSKSEVTRKIAAANLALLCKALKMDIPESVARLNGKVVVVVNAPKKNSSGVLENKLKDYLPEEQYRKQGGTTTKLQAPERDGPFSEQTEQPTGQRAPW